MRERTDSLVRWSNKGTLKRLPLLSSPLRLPVVEVEVLSALPDYIHSSRLTLTQLNVESLLTTADLLQLGAVKKACEAFLVRLLDVDNCLGMLAFSQLHACLTLEKEARRQPSGSD
ncbi:kelch-like protein 23 [Etheostoma cragini]|uniref:kelch-like protein 23 n=1 Tax=Etheostoma cragini TaxID=417921 RepID=UPI00155ED5F0|nr:kelch-like protein 23 [Etheostoma cragini]